MISKEWLTLRAADKNFVLDSILAETAQAENDSVYALIDTDEIGLFGHSLGGAAAAEMGGERSDIASTICIDGSMLGEAAEFENDAYVYDDTPYPIPLLNIYAQSHYEEAQELKDLYYNYHASCQAVESYDILFKGAGNLNLTDFPLISSALASMLGTGEVDSRDCIESMNQLILEFFDYTLKDQGTFTPQEVYE